MSIFLEIKKNNEKKKKSIKIQLSQYFNSYITIDDVDQDRKKTKREKNINYIPMKPLYPFISIYFLL